MKHLLCFLFVVGFAIHSYACDFDPPAQVWVYANDHNNDGKLDFNEWQHAQTGKFVLEFKAGDPALFRRLDKNHDGFIGGKNTNQNKELWPLWDMIHYVKLPCVTSSE